MRAWRKDLLFIVFLLGLAGVVLAGLEQRNRLEQRPESQPADWRQQNLNDVVARLDAQFEAEWNACSSRPPWPTT
jgi:hypothetical protein